MRFAEFKGEILKKQRNKMYKLEAELREFLAMNVKVATVTFTENEYKNLKAAYESLHRAAKRFALPVTVMTRNGLLYLINNDI